MKPGLQLRLSQQLTLTPQLQQSIRLLQLSTLELNQEVEQALQENPLLEREDDPLSGHLRLGADGSILQAPTTADAGGGEGGGEGSGTEPAGQGTEPAADGDRDNAPGEAESWLPEAQTTARATDDDSGERPQDWATAAPTLRDHLRMQLGTTTVTDRDRAIILGLIEAVDDNGYLGVSLDDLLAMADPQDGFDEQEILTALRLLQSFDPPGVAARNASECMSLQIDARLQALGTREDPEGARAHRVLEVARVIVRDHLPLLAARDFPRLRRLLGVDDDLLRAAHLCIRGLNPYPGVGFAATASDYVVPDIFVRRAGGRWVARLNPEVMPRLRINTAYATILRTEHHPKTAAPTGTAGTGGAAGEAAPGAAAGAADWATRLQDARWLIRNLRQRFQTIERVAQAIVDRQSRFFTYGAIAMRPLVLREIAETLDLHESTVSRVTSNKYMETPFGVYELRYFFGSHVATDAGGEASSTAIRALIRQLVDAEDKRNPLSDSRLAQLLAEQGMVVARRTVAKYREQTQIPTAALRRTI